MAIYLAQRLYLIDPDEDVKEHIIRQLNVVGISKVGWLMRLVHQHSNVYLRAETSSAN